MKGMLVQVGHPTQRAYIGPEDWDSFSISAYIGEDGVHVVHVGTPEDKAIAANGMPVMRLYVNDGLVWEGKADGSEEYGE